MSRTQRNRRSASRMLCVAIAACGGLTGCQFDSGGQTLPSPYYLYDDVQYFPAGPEFKLSREAAAMDEARARVESGAQP